jgi:hypothetical protein
MKDEYNRLLINEGLFISSKLYGLRLSSDKEIIKSREIPAKRLILEDLIRIQKSEEIKFKRTQPRKAWTRQGGDPLRGAQLFKSLNNLSIFEKEIDETIKQVIS